MTFTRRLPGLALELGEGDEDIGFGIDIRSDFYRQNAVFSSGLEAGRRSFLDDLDPQGVSPFVFRC